MKKLFIAQPMKGKSEEVIMAERELAIEKAKKEIGDDVNIIESYFPENAPANSVEGLYYLGKSIQLLSTADIAYFAPGWNDARGCKIENTCAKEYGIKVIEA